ERRRRIIITSGTSILRNLEKRGIDPSAKDVTARLNKSWLEAQETPHTLSAEISGLHALECRPDDRVFLLSTDTETGENAARLIEHLARHLFALNDPPEIERISGLRLEDVDEFQKKGLRSLVQTFDRLLDEAERQREEVTVGIFGGIKPIIPYVATYSMFRHVPLVYLFERTDRLISLPPLPLDFDWNALADLQAVLREIDRETFLPRGKLLNLLGGEERFREVSWLFEVEGENFTLSPFGQMLLEDFRQMEETVVYLSPRAKGVLDDVKEEGSSLYPYFSRLLARARNPFWRRQKLHSFVGTDLDVWKPGNTGERVAGWYSKTENALYIAELYRDHDRYERDLPKQKRKDYDPSRFVEWKPESVFSDPMTEEEKEGIERIKIAEKRRIEVEEKLAAAEGEKKRLHEQLEAMEREKEEIAGRLSTLEGERARLAEEQATLQKTLHELEERHEALAAQERARQGWSLLRRLSWALFRK
ncbi:MAG: hypothetical protein D6812_10320, partial [Deltaproteobacteria bacterium]